MRYRLAFTAQPRCATLVRVELCDKLGGSRVVGAGVVDVSRVIGAGVSGVTARDLLLCALDDSRGTVELLVSCAIGPAAASLAGPGTVPATLQGVLDVCVISASQLRPVDAFGKQDPYVRVSLLDASGRVVSCR